MSDWLKTNRGNPCQVCGRGGWCTISADGAVCKCMRIAEGSFKQSEDGSGIAYYHRLIDNPDWRDTPPPPKRKPLAVDTSLAKLAGMARGAASTAAVDSLAEELGLSPESLRRMDIGWVTAAQLTERGTRCKSRGCWTFPMRDARGEVVGIRLRTPDGFKYAVSTGDDCIGSGIFIPRDLGQTGKPHLLIAEGPTDTAALLDMGFDALGRPSNTAGTAYLRDYIVTQTLAMGWSEVVILIDRDKPGSDAAKNTWRGARSLAEALLSPRRSVRIVQPPLGVKDARDWLKGGANEDDVLGLIDGEEPLTRGRYDWMRNTNSAA